jgi:TetR/AcrR family transcriptional repressor of mexJK operon
VFLDVGFEGFSIEAVAAKALVSKVTVYKHFMDRENLIGAVISRESAWMEQTARAFAAASPAGMQTLTDFGVQLITFLARPDVMALDARMQQAPERHLPIVARYFRQGPARLMAAMQDMTTLAAEKGLISGDPREAAQTLLALWLNAIPLPARLGLMPPPSARSIRAAITRGTEIFLLAYAPRR